MGLLKVVLGVTGAVNAVYAVLSIPPLARIVRKRCFPKVDDKDTESSKALDHTQATAGALMGGLAVLNFLSLSMGSDARFKVGIANLVASVGMAAAHAALPVADVAVKVVLGVVVPTALAAGVVVNRLEPGIFEKDKSKTTTTRTAAKTTTTSTAAKKKL